MDYNTAIVLFGLFSTGLLLGGFGALVSLKGENLTADVAGHGVVSGVVISQGVVVWLGMVWLSVPLLWALGFATSALTLGFIFWARGRGFSPGAAQALAISFAYGSTLVLLSLVQGSGAFSTKGLTTLLLGDAATLTLSRVLPALGVLLLAASGFVLLRRPLLNWVLDQESVALQGNKRRLEALWVVATVVVVLTCLPALGLTLLVGGMTLPALIVRPWITGFTSLVVGSALIGGVFATLAGWLSAGVLPLPTGALVIVSLGLGWAVSFVAARLLQTVKARHAD
ncbi:MAG: metal ABC transporter permease [Alphaproteobacteria bacterium]